MSVVVLFYSPQKPLLLSRAMILEEYSLSYAPKSFTEPFKLRLRFIFFFFFFNIEGSIPNMSRSLTFSFAPHPYPYMSHSVGGCLGCSLTKQASASRLPFFSICVQATLTFPALYQVQPSIFPTSVQGL